MRIAQIAAFVALVAGAGAPANPATCATPYASLVETPSHIARVADAVELVTGLTWPSREDLRIGPFALPRLALTALARSANVRPHWQLVGQLPADTPLLSRARAISLATKTAQGLYDVLGPQPRNVARLLFPGLVAKKRDAAQKILDAQWRDPARHRPGDLETLVEYGRLDDFLRQQELVTRMPRLHRLAVTLSRWGGRLAAVPHWTLLAVALGGAMQKIARDDENPDLTAYLNDPQFAPADDEVQLVENTVPFPHLAIRIGNRVYSYGVSHLTSQAPEVYFQPSRNERLRARFREVLRRLDELPPAEQAAIRRELSPEQIRRWTEGEAPPDFSGRQLAVAMSVVKDLPQTYQIVTLKVGRAERDRLLKYFEMQKGKRYDNRTLVNDCATMVARALDLENPIVDPSPTLLRQMLEAKRLVAGDARIGKSFTVYGADAQRSPLTLLRDAYIGYRETALHYQLLPVNLPRRLAMDGASPERLQWWDSETSRELEKTRDEARDRLALDPAADEYRDLARKQRGRDLDKRMRVKRLVDEYLAEKRAGAQRELDDPGTLLEDHFLATYRLEAYDEYERAIYADLGFGPPPRN